LKKTITSVFVTSTLLLATHAHAQWYVGATAGEAQHKQKTESFATQFLDLGYSASQTRTDNRGSAYRVFGGYQLHRYVAVEAGYVDLGKFNLTSTVVPAGTLERRSSVKGFDVGVVGLLPLTTKLVSFVRIGAFRSKRKEQLSASGSIELLPTITDVNERQTKLTYGIGLTYDVTKNVGLRGEWNQYRRYNDALLETVSNINMVSLGLVYRF
jgi:OmpA-OmpF porin, OOP family